mmetsp:Transcript_17869/g.50003  ORF Transcript_17869/g.50003 Transcript_17869/m.50003 type:complete len:105 (+) Transcript_17869:130-444(+)
MSSRLLKQQLAAFLAGDKRSCGSQGSTASKTIRKERRHRVKKRKGQNGPSQQGTNGVQKRNLELLSRVSCPASDSLLEKVIGASSSAGSAGHEDGDLEDFDIDV